MDEKTKERAAHRERIESAARRLHIKGISAVVAIGMAGGAAITTIIWGIIILTVYA